MINESGKTSFEFFQQFITDFPLITNVRTYHWNFPTALPLAFYVKFFFLTLLAFRTTLKDVLYPISDLKQFFFLDLHQNKYFPILTSQKSVVTKG